MADRVRLELELALTALIHFANSQGDVDAPMFSSPTMSTTLAYSQYDLSRLSRLESVLKGSALKHLSVRRVHGEKCTIPSLEDLVSMRYVLSGVEKHFL